MSEQGISPQLPVAIGLAAIIPLIAYGMATSLSAALVATINVLLIVGVLFLVMRPIDPREASQA